MNRSITSVPNLSPERKKINDEEYQRLKHKGSRDNNTQDKNSDNLFIASELASDKASSANKTTKDKATKRLTEVNNKLYEENQHLRKENEQLKEELAKLRQLQANDLEANHPQNSSQNAIEGKWLQLLQENEQLSAELTKTREKKELLASNNKKYEGLIDEKNELIQELKKNIFQLEQNLNDANRLIDELTKETQMLQQSKAPTTNHEEVELLRKKNKEQKQENKLLLNKCEMLDKKLRDAGNPNTQQTIAELNLKLTQLNKENQEQRKKYQDLQEHIDLMKQTNQYLRNFELYTSSEQTSQAAKRDAKLKEFNMYPEVKQLETMFKNNVSFAGTAITDAAGEVELKDGKITFSLDRNFSSNSIISQNTVFIGPSKEYALRSFFNTMETRTTPTPNLIKKDAIYPALLLISPYFKDKDAFLRQCNNLTKLIEQTYEELQACNNQALEFEDKNLRNAVKQHMVKDTKSNTLDDELFDYQPPSFKPVKVKVFPKIVAIILGVTAGKVFDAEGRLNLTLVCECEPAEAKSSSDSYFYLAKSVIDELPLN